MRGCLVQVAAQPEMAALLSGFIYSSEGQEIYLRRPLHYHLPDHSITFSEVLSQFWHLCTLPTASIPP